MKANDWVANVRGALSGSDATQPTSSNHVHSIDGDAATCVSDRIARHHLVVDGRRTMHKPGVHYVHRLRITGLAGVRLQLDVTWQTGDRGLFQIAADRWAKRQADD